MRAPFPTPPRTDPIPEDLPVETASIIRWRLVGTAMLLVGALVTELALLTASVQTDQPALVHVVAALFVVLAPFLLRVRVERYRNFARFVIGATVVAIGLLAIALQGVNFVPLFFIWPLLAAAYLLGRTEFTAISVATFAVCGAALALRDGAFPLADYVAMVLVGTVVLGTVRVLAEGLAGTVRSLRHRSLTDPLTGLLNRRGFEAALARAYQRARFDGRPITSLLLDLDHFKAINDTYGHQAGDRALQRFAELMERSCRASDIVARVGGEEFAFVMPGATIEQAVARADQLGAALRADEGAGPGPLTVSIGIAGRARDCDDPSVMLGAADAAVYAAKRAGRDRTVVAPPVPGPGAPGESAPD